MANILKRQQRILERIRRFRQPKDRLDAPGGNPDFPLEFFSDVFGRQLRGVGSGFVHDAVATLGNFHRNHEVVHNGIVGNGLVKRPPDAEQLPRRPDHRIQLRIPFFER